MDEVRLQKGARHSISGMDAGGRGVRRLSSLFATQREPVSYRALRILDLLKEKVVLIRRNLDVFLVVSKLDTVK